MSKADFGQQLQRVLIPNMQLCTESVITVHDGNWQALISVHLGACLSCSVDWVTVKGMMECKVISCCGAAAHAWSPSHVPEIPYLVWEGFTCCAKMPWRLYHSSPAFPRQHSASIQQSFLHNMRWNTPQILSKWSECLSLKCKLCLHNICWFGNTLQ